MALVGGRTFVGFGFGAIQAGLFLYEAYQSNAFNRLVVAEIMPEVVANVRQAGAYSLNIAMSDRIDQKRVGPIQIENPAVEEDRLRLIDAVAVADELATAVPSVDFYTSPGPGSLHRILAEGLRRKVETGGPPCVVYAAENYNSAARILKEHVLGEIPAEYRDALNSRVCFVDTVIAKMCGVHLDAADLAPVVPGSQRSFLVESFNNIEISRISFAADSPHFTRGISVFEEKDDLAPFEEAKLYGHNAVHALAAYVGAACGVEYVSELRHRDGMMELLTNALVQESGGALLTKYGGVDEFFTPFGYVAFAEDLLARMVNPNLRDTVERIGRDPARKLGWNDRLIGAMRLCHSMGGQCKRYSFGAAAALEELDGSGNPELVLPTIWQSDNPDPAEVETMLALVHEGQETLHRWRDNGFGNPEEIFR